LKSKLSGGRDGVELVKWVTKSIFELSQYKLNYLFKYSKSVAESSSIIITVPT
jgi:hypothetical protein